MKLIDNAISEEAFKKIYDIVTDTEMPWHYSSTAYENDGGLFDYSFSHLVYLEGIIKSSSAKYIWPAVKELIAKAGHNMDELLRIRIGLVGITAEQHIHKVHVDYDFPHKTGLLYLNDCNGPTYIYNELYNPELGDRQEQAKDLTLKALIEPKANRACLFDGFHFHSSSTPTDIPRRLVINFNYTVKE
jgi:hypothetical protein